MRTIRVAFGGVLLLVCACQGQATFEGLPAHYWVKQLKDPNYVARMRAANAMSHLGEAGKASIPELILLLDDQQHLVRWAAAGSLGTFGAAAEKALPALEQMAEHEPAASARSAAADAVRDIRRALK